jgi:hypothetical protein
MMVLERDVTQLAVGADISVRKQHGFVVQHS